MNILFYAPFNTRSRDTESLMHAFRKQGHNVFFLSKAEAPDYVHFLNREGITAFYKAYKSTFIYMNLFLDLWYLIRFCRKHRIQVLYSHLESAHFVAVLAQYFIPSRVIVCRHHVDEIHLNEKHKSLSYYLIYKLAREIIVVSQRARDFMINVEGVSASKIYKINLAYDFGLYEPVNEQEVSGIRKKFGPGLLIVTACRLVKDKRPELSIALLKELLQKGISAKLLILGKGDLYSQLQKMIDQDGLKDHCYLLGHQKNILEYLKAADAIFHPSLLDSSSVIVKEAGLMGKVVIVCNGVGDFNNYIRTGVNGILADKEDPVKDAIAYLEHYDTVQASDMGSRLHDDILRLFSIENILPEYSRFNSEKK